jgi:hypothetical protein
MILHSLFSLTIASQIVNCQENSSLVLLGQIPLLKAREALVNVEIHLLHTFS